jgi:hypothetical protein
VRTVNSAAVAHSEHNALAATLAAADAQAFREEGPRIDNRIGTLLSLLLGGMASSSVLGGVGASLSRERHADVAMVLLATAAVVIAVGLVLIVRLILPRLSPRITARSGALAQVAALPDVAAVRDFYRVAAQDRLGYQAGLARAHAVAIRRRFFRFRRAGWVLVAGVLLATCGFLALGWGW